MNKLLLRKALQWINSVTFKYEKRKEILTASVQTSFYKHILLPTLTVSQPFSFWFFLIQTGIRIHKYTLHYETKIYKQSF